MIIWEWFTLNYIEVLGALTGIIYLYFSINQIIWLWPLGLVTSGLYIYVFYHSGLFADMGLQIYYLFISLYGWHHWLTGGKNKAKIEHNSELPVGSLSFKQ